MKYRFFWTLGLISIFSTGSVLAQDSNIQISLDAPTYGININTNFPGVDGNGRFARGYKVSNADGSVTFIQFGTLGTAGNGSSELYSYIGKDWDNPYMLFEPTGNIGIGLSKVSNTEGWGRVLEIHGEGNSKALVTSTNVHSGLWSHDGGIYGAPIGGMVGTHTEHPFSIITNRSAKLTVLNNGNTGIGTINPLEKLAVNGNIRATEIKVEVANWPDYVFEEGYNLPTLKELDSYIKANKHLPGVPKASDVSENGISLGEMNKILLEKIEELTLLMISKDKELDNQRKEIIEIKKHLNID